MPYSAIYTASATCGLSVLTWKQFRAYAGQMPQPPLYFALHRTGSYSIELTARAAKCWRSRRSTRDAAQASWRHSEFNRFRYDVELVKEKDVFPTLAPRNLQIVQVRFTNYPAQWDYPFSRIVFLDGSVPGIYRWTTARWVSDRIDGLAESVDIVVFELPNARTCSQCVCCSVSCS